MCTVQKKITARLHMQILLLIAFSTKFQCIYMFMRKVFILRLLFNKIFIQLCVALSANCLSLFSIILFPSIRKCKGQRDSSAD